MPEELLQRIESRIDVLDGRVDRIGQDLKDLHQDVGDLRQDVQVMRHDMQEMGQDLRNRIDEGQRHMHVLHEDLVERITALAPDFGPIRREFRRDIAELRESFDRRLIPLEAAAWTRRRPKR